MNPTSESVSPDNPDQKVNLLPELNSSATMTNLYTCQVPNLAPFVTGIGLCSVIGNVLGIVIFPLSSRFKFDGSLMSLTLTGLMINLVAAALMVYGAGRNRRWLAVPWLVLQLNVHMILVYFVASDPHFVYAIGLVIGNIWWLLVLTFVVHDRMQEPIQTYPPIA